VTFRTGREPNPVLDKILLSAPAKAGDEVNAGKPARLSCSGTSGESVVRGGLPW